MCFAFCSAMNPDLDDVLHACEQLYAPTSLENFSGRMLAALSGALGNVGAFALPAGAKDAALVTTLQPGSYTVQVSGVGGSTGVALVEVYEVP